MITDFSVAFFFFFVTIFSNSNNRYFSVIFCNEMFSGSIKTATEKNPCRVICRRLQTVFCFVEQPVTSPRRQHTTSSIHTKTHKKHTAQTHHTTKHIFFSAQVQAHFIPSGTRLAQESMDNSFLHAANMFARQGMDQGKSGRAYSESQLDERSLSLLLRSVRSHFGSSRFVTVSFGVIVRWPVDGRGWRYGSWRHWQSSPFYTQEEWGT